MPHCPGAKKQYNYTMLQYSVYIDVCYSNDCNLVLEVYIQVLASMRLTYVTCLTGRSLVSRHTFAGEHIRFRRGTSAAIFTRVAQTFVDICNINILTGMYASELDHRNVGLD